MSIAPGTLHPTNELVGVGWLRGVTGLEYLVATEVPTDTSTWVDFGFLQVTAVGGYPNPEIPVRQPVFSLDMWACNPGSGKLPWHKANQLSEHVREAFHEHASIQRRITTPTAYADAVVMDAVLLTEPRRIRDDPGDFAHYTADLQLWWFETPKP